MKLISDKNEVIIEHFYQDETELLIIDNYKKYNLPKGEFKGGVKELREYLLTPSGIELNYLILISGIDTEEFKTPTDYLKSVGLDITNYLL